MECCNKFVIIIIIIIINQISMVFLDSLYTVKPLNCLFGPRAVSSGGRR